MTVIKGCEVCGSTHLERVLDLGAHPMCDDLVPLGDPRRPRDYPIAIGFCNVCRTAHQMHQIPKETLFPHSYHYRARQTADVLEGMRRLVERCEKRLGSLRDLTVIDIGCNDGSLLSYFARRGAATIGVEPTGAFEDAVKAGHRVYHDYLNPALAQTIVADHGAPAIITFTNVFAHIEDLQGVLKSVAALLGPATLLVIENHYLGAVLDRAQFDTFYHEHPRTYSLTSFKHIAQALEAHIVATEFPARYGGNIRVMITKHRDGPAGSENDAAIVAEEGGFRDRLIEIARAIPVWREKKRIQLIELANRFGPLPGKAFPGRAAILVKLLDLTEEFLYAVHEKPGSMKIGHYLPGTRIPILSDTDFASHGRDERPLLNLAWHIPAEIRKYMRERGFGGPVIDIFDPQEFEGLK